MVIISYVLLTIKRNYAITFMTILRKYFDYVFTYFENECRKLGRGFWFLYVVFDMFSLLYFYIKKIFQSWILFLNILWVQEIYLNSILQFILDSASSENTIIFLLIYVFFSSITWVVQFYKCPIVI